MKRTLLFAIALVSLVSCSAPRKIAYFKDTDSVVPSVAPKKEIIIQPGDAISIIVNCPTSKLTSLFNLPMVSKRMGQDSDDVTVSSNQTMGYNVGMDGYIDFPVLGRIMVAGKTREQIARMIKEELIEREQASEVVVTVDFLNLTYQVLGEVTRPGRFAITKDGVTVTDAIAAAGDLTIFGKRDNIKVLRNEGGYERTYQIDLCSAASLYSSPAYYLQQNDVIYVEPNNVRKRQSTVNGNNVRSTSFWMSLASLASSVTMIVFSLVK